MQKPALVIMAAGLGSRYGGLKQAEPVGPHGALIIDYYIIRTISNNIIVKLFVIIHYFRHTSILESNQLQRYKK